MSTHVIDFLPTGEAQAMHNDKFDLSILGRQKIERATEIKFDGATQKWGIWFPRPWPHVGGEFDSCPEADGFATYEGARTVEVAWLNAARLAGCDPKSLNGLSLLRGLRESLNQ